MASDDPQTPQPWAGEVCRPWSIDCGEPAVILLATMCCGREVPICEGHRQEALDEIRPNMYCLTCGEVYTQSSWTVMELVPRNKETHQ